MNNNAGNINNVSNNISNSISSIQNNYNSSNQNTSPFSKPSNTNSTNPFVRQEPSSSYQSSQRTSVFGTGNVPSFHPQPSRYNDAPSFGNNSN